MEETHWKGACSCRLGGVVGTGKGFSFESMPLYKKDFLREYTSL